MQACVAILLSVVVATRANYRKFGFYNHDLCSLEDKEKSLQLGAGAALLTLDRLSLEVSKCSVKIEADHGLGLMVYIEEMYLRSSSTSGDITCQDYVQFGRDDRIPFYTIFKSEKLCGNMTGFRYDEPGGKLLVWLSLGRAPRPKADAHLPDRLTVVITAYKHGKVEESTDFRLCKAGDRLVRKEYFCDWRVNCAFDKEPGDERPEICRYSRGSLGGSGGAGGKGLLVPAGDFQPPLNLVSITLVLVSGVVVLVLLLLLVAWIRRSRIWCYKQSATNIQECELPERTVTAGNSGMLPLASTLHAPNTAVYRERPGGSGGLVGSRATGYGMPVGGDRSDNIYQPLPIFVESRRVGDMRGSTPDTEPPPAYHDLFPVGHVYKPEKRHTNDEVLVGDSAVRDFDPHVDRVHSQESILSATKTTPLIADRTHEQIPPPSRAALRPILPAETEDQRVLQRSPSDGNLSGGVATASPRSEQAQDIDQQEVTAPQPPPAAEH